MDVDSRYLRERLWAPLCARAPTVEAVGGPSSSQPLILGCFHQRIWGRDMKSLLGWVELSQLSGWNLGQSALEVWTRTPTGPCCVCGLWSTHSREGFIDWFLLQVQQLNHMCVQASSYTAPSPTAVKSVCFWYCLKHGWVPLPLPKSPGDPVSFHPQPSEPHPGRAVPPLNGCFNDSSCGEDGRLEELLHVQPLISWHFDTSICQKHLSNNLFPIRVSFYCFLLFKKKKAELES